MDTSGNVVWDYTVTGSAITSVNTGNILDGNTDGWYTIITMLVGNATNAGLNIRLNGDSGTNYGRVGIYATNTSVSADDATARSFIASAYTASSGQVCFCIGTLHAKSGVVRLYNNIQAESISTTTVTALSSYGQVWNNTANNITNITFYSPPAGGSDVGIGSRIIILKGNALAVGTSPGNTGAWKRVGSSVLGGAASSIAFSSLTGDTAVCYYLSIAGKAAAGAGLNSTLRFNSDSGTNYGRQKIDSFGTSVTAARTTGMTGLQGLYASTTAYYASNAYIIFAKSGFVRPVIHPCEMESINGTTIDGFGTWGQVWSNTANAITDATFTATTGQFAAGTQVDLYALYN